MGKFRREIIDYGSRFPASRAAGSDVFRRKRKSSTRRDAKNAVFRVFRSYFPFYSTGFRIDLIRVAGDTGNHPLQ